MGCNCKKKNQAVVPATTVVTTPAPTPAPTPSVPTVQQRTPTLEEVFI